MNSSNQLQKEHNKTKAAMKEGYEKLMLKYSDIESSVKNLSANIPEEYKEDTTKILKNLQTFKESFKSFISKISQNIKTMVQHSEPNTTITDQSKEIVISPRIKNSYDQISNEFTKLEKITKEVLQCKSQIKAKKNKRILLLEQQLQAYCNGISHINFNNIQKEMDAFTLNNKDKICNYISENSKINGSFLIDYSIKDSSMGVQYDDEDNKDENYEDEEDLSMQNNSNKEASYYSEEVEYSPETNRSIVDKIVEGNPSKKEEMIDLIENIMLKQPRSPFNIFYTLIFIC